MENAFKYGTIILDRALLVYVVIKSVEYLDILIK